MLPSSAWADAGRRALQVFNLREQSYAYHVSPRGGIVRLQLPRTPGQQADINLNGAAFTIGFLLGLGLINRNQVGGWVRRNICGP